VEGRAPTSRCLRALQLRAAPAGARGFEAGARATGKNVAGRGGEHRQHGPRHAERGRHGDPNGASSRAGEATKASSLYIEATGTAQSWRAGGRTKSAPRRSTG